MHEKLLCHDSCYYYMCMVRLKHGLTCVSRTLKYMDVQGTHLWPCFDLLKYVTIASFDPCQL